ncbi:hypothetical protein SteCoe_13230 [Stentor coeruleus]|uniref:MD-2-related lipid-recognition domain-containing protein n=1 Tax=Stentor coeruleus TaxID=5963 RepID=A0A1R2C8Y7_9CILI|nr:hypothetical protein SteCoe_13230 [Stentor coeruleus]
MIAYLVLLVLANASSNFESYQSVGANCSATITPFQITSFVVNPWPITNQTSVDVSVTGTLSATTYVNEFWISSTSQNYFNNQQATISRQYFPGSITFPITYQVQYPSAYWLAVFTLRDSNFKILACWQFGYTSI